MVRRGFAAMLSTVVMVIAALSCSGEAPAPRTALTPIATAEVPGAIDLGSVPSSTAIASGRQHVLDAADRIGPIEMPGEIIARLTTAGDVASWTSGLFGFGEDYPPVSPDALVWAVQVKGSWRPAGGATTGIASPATARFAIVAIDAHTGEPVAGAVSPAPFFTPAAMRTKASAECVALPPADARVTLGPREAIEAARATYAAGATNKFGTEWDPDQADAEVVRCIETVGGVDTFRWRWFVTVPSSMALHDCSTPSARAADLKRRCWSPVATHLVDGVSGQVLSRREIEFTGPLLTDQEFEDVKRFAGSAGWWEAWARLNPFNDSIIPARALSAMFESN